ncbi:putative RNA-directed DNA polymerase from transposon X-element [Formica fusca]
MQNQINSLCPSSCFYEQKILSDTNSNDYACKYFDSPFKEEELLYIIHSLKKRSSPGIDQIDYRIISHLPHEYHLLLLTAFNQIFFTGLFPDAWRHSLVFLIPKTTPGKYRPISLTSCCLKLLEKLILLRLDWWLEHNLKLPNSQFGFRKFRSCQDNLSSLITEVHGSFSKGNSTACLFLDLSNAFDDVIPNILMNDLDDIGLSPILRQFIYNLISFRKIQFCINGELTDEFHSYKGVPQGSILSPTLFNIYISKLRSSIGRSCELIQFADDIAIFHTSSQIHDSISKIETAAKRACDYLTTKGLTVSPTKSSLVVFTRKRVDPLSFSIKILNNHIPSTYSCRFLGIHLDCRLSGREHSRFLLGRCSKLINILSMLRGTWWGASPQLLLSIYRALIRSSMEYGCSIFPLNNRSILYQLEKIQFRALRLCTGLRRTTPINVLLAESGESSLKHRFFYLTSRYILKIFSLDDHPTIEKLHHLHWCVRNSRKKNPADYFLLYKSFCTYLKYKRYIACSIFPSVYSIDYWAHVTSPSIRITSALDVESIKNNPFPTLIFFDIYHDLLQDYIPFYTDASKVDEISYVGFATYSPTLNLQLLFRTYSFASIFSAEAYAILQTLTYILDNSIPRSVIFTDSLSVTQALSSFNFGHSYSHIIHAIRSKIHVAYSTGFQVVIVWIPSHSGILGNETADLLAKNVITKGTWYTGLLPYSDFFSVVRKNLIADMTDLLKKQARYKGINYFRSFDEFRPRPWFYEMKNFNRESITTCCRIRSGHYALNSSLYRCNLVPQSSCPCGALTQDINHILWSCPLLNTNRHSMIRALNQLDIFPPMDAAELLAEPSSGVVLAIYSFLKSYLHYFQPTS